VCQPTRWPRFDRGLARLKRDGLDTEAAALRSLRDKVMSLVPRKQVIRLETDEEAILEAQGFIARPGPRPKFETNAVALIVQAIKACKVVEFDYRSQSDRRAKSRRVAPYGFLSGLPPPLSRGWPATRRKRIAENVPSRWHPQCEGF